MLDVNLIKKISDKYGDAFYLLDTNKFIGNFRELQDAMRQYYDKSFIAYSYKTNYIPKLCGLVNNLGGFAEVVSRMEIEIARRSGVEWDHIIFNGPYKDYEYAKKLLLNGGMLNIDSLYDFNIVENIVQDNTTKNIKIGIRCNFDIYDGVISRFGFDVNSDSFLYVLNKIGELPNCDLLGFHCHFASRDLEHWNNRVSGMLDIIEKYYPKIPQYISFGGGIFGKMKETLKKQFDCYIPSYQEYAEVIAKKFAEKFNYFDKKYQPKMFIEPGSALSGDIMKFVSKIIDIKNKRGKNIATLLGSIYNINPTLNGKNPPIRIINKYNNEKCYENVDMGGYTCIENDYLYRGYSGKCNVGDYVVFDNVGSYSIVLKPPFILPNFPILEIVNNEIIEIKRGETFEDLFNTYIF